VKSLSDRLKPIGRILDLSDDGWTVWDCSPIREPASKRRENEAARDRRKEDTG